MTSTYPNSAASGWSSGSRTPATPATKVGCFTAVPQLLVAAGRSGSRAGRARIGLVVPGECRESHAGARQRGWRLSGLDWAAPKERITLPKHNAALYAEREESKEGSERRSEPTTRISSAHLQGHRRTTNSPALVIRAMQSEGEQLSGRPVSGRGRREVRHTARFRSIRPVSFESIGLAVGLVCLVRADTQYPDDDIPINDQTDRPDPEDFRVDSCSERAQRTFCNRCLPCKVSCRGAAGAR